MQLPVGHWSRVFFTSVFWKGQLSQTHSVSALYSAFALHIPKMVYYTVILYMHREHHAQRKMLTVKEMGLTSTNVEAHRLSNKVCILCVVVYLLVFK